MVRFRKIKKWANSYVVVLTSTDIKDLGVKEGDYLDIEDGVIISEKIFNAKFKEEKK